MTTTLVPTRVSVDADGATVVDALHDPAEHWNGWAVPHLTRKAVDTVFGEAKEEGAEIAWRFDEDGTLVLVDYPGTSTEYVTRIPQVNGRYRLDIGWCFVTDNAEEN